LVTEKNLRLCPVQLKKVVCDGICETAVGDDSGESVLYICPIREKALDLALNC